MAYEQRVLNLRGRCKETWKEVVGLDLKCMNLSASEALDRTKWRN